MDRNSQVKEELADARWFATTHWSVVMARMTHLELSSRLEPAAIRLGMEGPRGVRVRLQRSTNLSNWHDWQSITLGAEPIEVSHTDAATAPWKFYRGIAP